MRLIDAAGWLLAGTGLPWLAHATENPQVPLHASEATWPVHQNDYCELVQWDHYSIIVKGQRIFIWSGELHLWRIPVPELWTDILQKIKAAGFNAIGLYENWGWHAPNERTLDFSTGAHSFRSALKTAKDLGLYILFRPGPYTHAEANGGGFPGWLTTGKYGSLRNDDPRYTAAWTRYYEAIADHIRPYLIENGGTIITWQPENEYGNQWLDVPSRKPNMTAIRYMELLHEKTRAFDVRIPTTANNPNMNTSAWSKDFSNVGGEADMYGLDHYPSCWTCKLQDCDEVNGAFKPYFVFDYYSHFMELAQTQPFFLSEFQGGAFNPWDGPTGGCPGDIGPTWANLFYRHNLAERITLVNVYMAYGGTNWGNLACPGLGTSYDYSAPISEARLITVKYLETKIFGLFIRVARDSVKVNRVGNSTEYSTNPDIFTTELRNPDTNAGFYVTRHKVSASRDMSEFQLKVSTSIGNLTVPQSGVITLDGRQSKILVTNFAIARSGKTLIYSTAEVLTLVDFGDRQVVVFWTPEGESGEFLLQGATSASLVAPSAPAEAEPSYTATTDEMNVLSNVTASGADIFTTTSNGVLASFTVTSENQVFEFDNGVQAVVVNREGAYMFWAPTWDTDPQAAESSTVLVQGPYLVRNAKIVKDTLYIQVDWSTETRVEIWADKDVQQVVVNDEKFEVAKTAYGSLIGVLLATSVTMETIEKQLPSLTEWKVADGLPETAVDYDDFRWNDADHETTMHPVPPDTFPVLFADQYGYQAGNLLWRARFEASADDLPSSVFIRAIGGEGSGWSAYLNGKFLGAFVGNMAVSDGHLELSFENVSISNESENVLFIILDTMGKDEREGVLNPRGILNATLKTMSGAKIPFSSWKLAGNAGGNQLLDPVRGTWNEGGLHAERLGWYLNGFDDGAWETGSPKTGFRGATARFYRKTFDLDLPANHDVSLAFNLIPPTRAKLRAQLYVNGYQFGKIIPVFGNQVEFPVPPGIFNYHGENTLGLSVWALDEEGASVDIQWKVLGVYRSPFDNTNDSSDLRPGWIDRSQYA